MIVASLNLFSKGCWEFVCSDQKNLCRSLVLSLVIGVVETILKLTFSLSLMIRLCNSVIMSYVNNLRVFSVEDEVTVGKFYATFLIQDYFRRFKKKKESRTATDNVDSQAQESQAVTLQVLTVPTALFSAKLQH